MEVEVCDDKTRHFIKSLDLASRAKITRLINLLEKHGSEIGMPHSRMVANQIYELRTQGNPSVRLFYCYYKSRAVILHGFIKKTNKTPIAELSIARMKLRLLQSV